MTVCFNYDNKVIATTGCLCQAPKEGETVKIFGEEYSVLNVYHEVEIRMKKSGNKTVTEKVFVDLIKE